MRFTLMALALTLTASAFAMPTPDEVLERLEREVIPAARSGAMRLTKLSYQNSSGRDVPGGVCQFSDGNLTVKVTYCQMPAPQAERIESTFADVGETHSFYVERNGANLLPRFSLNSKNAQEGTCVMAYFNPMCSDRVWLDEVRDLVTLNNPSDGPQQMVAKQMALATRMERVAKTLRDLGRTRN